MVTATLINRVILIVAGLVLLGLAVRIYRQHEKPTATSFAILMSLLGVTAFCTGVTATTGWPNKVIWLYTNLAIPVVLVYFSFDYYGIDLFNSRERFALITAPAALGAAGGSILILGTDTFSSDGTAPVAALSELPPAVFHVAGTLDEFGYYYITALILVAVGLVFQNILRYDHLDRRLGLVIAFVGIWPWLGNFVVPQLQTMVGPLAGLLALSSGYAISAAVAVLIVGPLGLFESSPAAGNVGSETVLDSVDDAVLMVDDNGHLLRLNATACETFETTESDAVGRSVRDLLGYPATELPEDEPVVLETERGERSFDVTHSSVVDRTGRNRGFVLVLRDVTDRLTREQRLEVLNRVLRHNLRNDATSILARAELIEADRDGGDAEQIIDKTQELIATAERAREIESMMDIAGEPHRAPLARTVDQVVDDVARRHPAVEFTTALPDEATVAVNSRVLQTVLSNLIENAAAHNDADNPIVVVSAERDADAVTVVVSDNGPGIPEYELSVLDAGTEGPLEHGSGLGLWAVQWGIAQMGGTLTVSDNEPRGTNVAVELPDASLAEWEQASSEGTLEA